MKCMLMMTTMRAGMGVPAWRRPELRAHLAFMSRINRELEHSGELVLAEALSFPGQARIVRAQVEGEPLIETLLPGKELLSGFWLVDVDTLARAYDIAARLSAAPGPEGSPSNIPIEVRPILSRSPLQIL